MKYKYIRQINDTIPDYFSSIGPNLAKQIINEHSNESIYSTMNENTKESLFLLPTTLTEIQKIKYQIQK